MKGAAALATVVILSATFFVRDRIHPEKRAESMAASPSDTELVVPHVHGSISLDGDLDDTGWLGPVARTGPFVDKNDGPARPYSEARITWGDGVLYLSLYAADEDIRVGASPAPEDAFHFVFDDGENERVFDVSAAATLSDGTRASAKAGDGGARAPGDFRWASGAHVSREIDGTPNVATDDDEEWALEIAIPLEAIGLSGEVGERVSFAIHRCDTPKNEARTCGSWGERRPAVLVLE